MVHFRLDHGKSDARIVRNVAEEIARLQALSDIVNEQPGRCVMRCMFFG
jgi:hypothetical protein